MKLKFANHEYELDGRYLGAELADSNDVMTNAMALRQRMAENGYLLIRGHDRNQVLTARTQILNELLNRGLLATDRPIDDAVFNTSYSEGASTTAMTNEALAQTAAIDTIVNGPRVNDFFRCFLGTDAVSFDYRWLRTAGTNASSPIHCDQVFMGRGSKDLYTCWTPLCDVSYAMGPLVLCLKSHRMDAITKSYGQCDVDRDLIAGHFSENPNELVDRFGGRWATTEFRAGDAIIFNMHILHASLVNTTNTVRISIDTRYQPANQPIDERWGGTNPLGHYAWKAPNAEIEPLATSRAKWGIN